MPSAPRGRRRSLTLVVCALTLVAGCLGGSAPGTGSPVPSAEPNDSNGTDVTESPTVTPGDRPARLGYGDGYFDYDESPWEELTDVETDGSSVVVTGRIHGHGDPDCFEMGASAARTADGTLVVAVETGTPDRDTSVVCEDLLKLWEYRVVVDVDAVPDRVVIEHDGEAVAATDAYDGTVLGGEDEPTNEPVTTDADVEG